MKLNECAEQRRAKVETRPPIPFERVRSRVLGYALTFAVVALAFMLSLGLHGVHDGVLQAVLTILAAFLSAFIGSIALIRYYVRKRHIYLWIGAGFVGNALLESYHIAVSAGFLHVSIAPDQTSLADWSHFAARTALALFLLFSWIAEWRRKHKNGLAPFPVWGVFTIVGGSVLGLISAMVFVSTPGQFIHLGVLGRPFDLLLAIPFAAALVGYLLDGDWRDKSFPHALVVALILNVGAHTLLLPFSREAFDPLFYVGQAAILASYVALVVGLLVSTYRVFRLAELRRVDSLRKTFDLTKERQRVVQSLAEVQTKEDELKSKVVELETTHSAVLNIMEDLDEEKRKLAQEKAKDEAILASVGEGLIVTDEQRRVTYANTAAELMIGFRLDNLKGQRWPEVVRAVNEDGTPVPIEETAIARAMRTLKQRSTLKPEQFTRRDGSTFAVNITAAPVLLAERPIGAIAVFRDVTREREIDKAKSEFVSLASHQLRTPLSTIKWYSEMLLGGDAGKLKEEQLEYMLEVSHANERMVDLVNALLNVSRIELGTFAVQPQPTDVVAVVKTVLREVAPQAVTKKLKIVEAYQENLPVLPADPNLLRIIIQNLVTNAIKYTPPKGQVWVRLRTVKAGEKIDSHKVVLDSIFFSVQDTGYGIPVAAQPKIFTKLFRADNVRERETDGTGLGLYIVKSIIEHADGDIWFMSDEKKGTTFYVLLPIAGMQRKKGAKQLT